MSVHPLVESFYSRLWSSGDERAQMLLTEDFSFRGSLGNVLQGRAAFLEYVRSVRRSLADYRCDIVTCVTEGSQAFARMRFSGVHVAPFRGFAPTGRLVEWEGAASFTFRGDAIADVWVLGDLVGLDELLRRHAAADGTAVRVALWRALHVEADPPPHVLEDLIGVRLAAPDDGWRRRPDMDPHATSRARASIVARARFIEDLVVEEAGRDVGQYVILGAGLDTFAQRRPAIASRLRIFEVDQPGPQAWKRQRLIELGFGIPEWLRLVPVDLEVDERWWQRLAMAGFDADQPAVVASTGVTMYLTRDAIAATLRRLATLAPGSTLAMTFMVPLELVEAEERRARRATEDAARAAGTPFVTFFAPPEILTLAREAGFKEARRVSAASLTQRYFAGRTDGFRPSSSEELLVAIT